MLAYVTGGAGFVAKWLTAHLEASGDEVVAVDAEVDITESEPLKESLRKVAPDVVYHLAGLTHVGRSWEDPAATFKVNALGTLNVLQAAAACDKAPKVLLVSSAEVYGGGSGEPLDEEAPLRPLSPYGASKAAAELIGLQSFLGGGLPVVRVRPFNHVGPGQAPFFVVSALAKRIAEAERTGTREVKVGNLESTRDFTDVRDVVRAYRLLAESGEPGEVYNVASGRARKVSDVAAELVSLASSPLDLARDESLFRPVEVPVFLGSPSKLVSVTGWHPEVELHRTLRDVLSYWRTEVAG